MLKEASIAEARARQAAQQEQLLADEAIAISQRQLALKQAEIAAETDAAKARAAAAGPLAQAAQDQAILIEQEKVAERTAALTERQLDTQVRRPADAAALPGRAGGRGPQELRDPHRRGAAPGDDRRRAGRRPAGGALR